MLKECGKLVAKWFKSETVQFSCPSIMPWKGMWGRVWKVKNVLELGSAEGGEWAALHSKNFISENSSPGTIR